jgi:hypothetical protein
VVDPTHPLYARRFALVSVTGGLVSTRYMCVEYRPGIALMLPLPVTSLWPNPDRRAVRTKLSVEALTELVTISGESEGTCPSSPETSGVTCPPSCADTSRPNSAPCCIGGRWCNHRGQGRARVGESFCQKKLILDRGAAEPPAERPLRGAPSASVEAFSASAKTSNVVVEWTQLAQCLANTGLVGAGVVAGHLAIELQNASFGNPRRFNRVG